MKRANEHSRYLAGKCAARSTMVDNVSWESERPAKARHCQRVNNPEEIALKPGRNIRYMIHRSS